MRVIATLAILLLTGCSASSNSEAEYNLADAVMIGELRAADSNISIGDVIPVIVDLPDDQWEVTNSNPDSVEVAETHEKVTVVTLTGTSPGESTVEFTAENGDTDSITVTVK